MSGTIEMNFEHLKKFTFILNWHYNISNRELINKDYESPYKPLVHIVPRHPILQKLLSILH